MKRLTALAEHERIDHLRSLNLKDMCEHGYHECKRCNLALQPHEVETRVDHDDDSRTWQVCGRCGGHQVVWRPPVLPE